MFVWWGGAGRSGDPPHPANHNKQHVCMYLVCWCVVCWVGRGGSLGATRPTQQITTSTAYVCTWCAGELFVGWGGVGRSGDPPHLANHNKHRVCMYSHTNQAQTAQPTHHPNSKKAARQRHGQTKAQESKHTHTHTPGQATRTNQAQPGGA